MIDYLKLLIPCYFINIVVDQHLKPHSQNAPILYIKTNNMKINKTRARSLLNNLLKLSITAAMTLRECAELFIYFFGKQF